MLLLSCTNVSLLPSPATIPSLHGYCNGMDEVDPWSPCPRPGQPDQNQRKADRDLRHLVEMTRLAIYLAETLEGLAETAKTIRTWPKADTHQVNLADG